MRPLAFQSHQRRQAPSFNREAAGYGSCGLRINLCPAPPHPPITKAAPGLGETLAKKRGAIAFFKMGARGELLKPVDSVGCHYVTPHSTKRSARFARMKLPHFGPFLPHFGPFLPHPYFLNDPHIYLSIYLFSEEKERKKGRRARKQRSTGGPHCNHMYPHFFTRIHGFLWMHDGPETQCWRGFRGFLRCIHTSTGGNALGGVVLARIEVRHGG